MSQFKPMKPPTGTLDIDTVVYPCWASIKYDGFRLAIKNGKTVSFELRVRSDGDRYEQITRRSAVFACATKTSKSDGLFVVDAGGDVC